VKVPLSSGDKVARRNEKQIGLIRSGQFAFQQRLCVQPVHPHYVVERDFLWAGGFAGANVGAIAEAFCIHLR
jgi:hypothetical protein